MTTTAAISPVIRNVLSVAKIPPMRPAPCAGRRCMLTGPRTGGPGGRPPQPPFATAAPGAEGPV